MNSFDIALARVVCQNPLEQFAPHELRAFAERLRAAVRATERRPFDPLLLLLDGKAKSPRTASRNISATEMDDSKLGAELNFLFYNCKNSQQLVAVGNHVADALECQARFPNLTWRQCWADSKRSRYLRAHGVTVDS